MQATPLTVGQHPNICAKSEPTIIGSANPAYTLATLLDGITDNNRHNELAFGEPQGQEQL